MYFRTSRITLKERMKNFRKKRRRTICIHFIVCDLFDFDFAYLSSIVSGLSRANLSALKAAFLSFNLTRYKSTSGSYNEESFFFVTLRSFC
ncbi:hypothetical protein AKO1_007221, partial [Acrasis kona]